jgi:hypothetical protein
LHPSWRLLFADLNDVSGFDRFISGATFGVQKLQDGLQGCGVGGVAQEGAFATHQD